MRRIKTLTAIMVLALVTSCGATQAFAGDMAGPGITGPQESPGAYGPMDTPRAAGDMQTPGVAGDMPAPGVAGDIQLPGFDGWMGTGLYIAIVSLLG